MGDLLNKVDNLILFFIIYTITFFVFFSTLNYTLPFVLALICSLIIKGPTLYISKRLGIKTSIASLITTILFFTIIIFLLSLGVTTIAQEAIQLGKNIQTYISQNSPSIYEYFNRLQRYYHNLDPNIVNTLEKNLSASISKLSNMTVSVTGKLISSLLAFLTTVPYLLMIILFTLLTTYFFTRDITSSKNKLVKIFSENETDKIAFVYSETKRMLLSYILSYLLIITITFIETLIVFLVFKIKYAVMLSVICAVADILPILGIGTIYVPIAIIYFFFVKNYVIAFGIIISYILISIIRQIIEPKIVSSTLGIHPVAVLAALFIGLKADGLLGILFCIFFVVLYNIFKKVDIL